VKKLLFITLLLIGGLTLQAQSQKIGFVDSQILYQNYAPAIKAQQDLQVLQQNWTRTRDSLTQVFQQNVQAYQQQSSMMTPQKKQETEQQLMMEQNTVLQQEQIVIQKGQSMMKPIRDAVSQAIAEVAKAQKMSFIFDKGVEGVVNILHFSDSNFDMTYKVLDQLKSK
jgi:outer membrane protein